MEQLPSAGMTEVICMAEIVPYNLPHFPHPCGSDAGGTSPCVVITPRHAGLDPVSMDSSVRWNDGSDLHGFLPSAGMTQKG